MRCRILTSGDDDDSLEDCEADDDEVAGHHGSRRSQTGRSAEFQPEREGFAVDFLQMQRRAARRAIPG
jgi:hypothetical protein